MDQITTAQITTALRQILLFAGGLAVARGWLTDSQLEVVVPAVITLAVAGYGIWKRRPAGIIKSAAHLKQVHAVITEPKVAKAVPAENVVGSMTEASRLPGVPQS